MPTRLRANILAADWPAPPGVSALTTLRAPAGVSSEPFAHFNLGDRCGDVPAAVAANRALLTHSLGLPEAPRWLHQVHGTAVVRFAREPPPAPVEADAAVTSEAGIVLAVLTADCLPVVLAARDGSEVAVAHAGWRGLAHGVLEATVQAMRTPPDELIAWLGPAAGASRYEIGTEVYRAFVDVHEEAAAAFVATRPGHWNIDLFALARRGLGAAGIDAIHGGDACTIGDPSRFFSYRRDGATGRMATIAWVS